MQNPYYKQQLTMELYQKIFEDVIQNNRRNELELYKLLANIPSSTYQSNVNDFIHN